MRLRYAWILVAVLLLLAWPVSAKGASDRIILTGPTLDGEIILTDRQVVYPLSFGSLENWNAGKIDEPTDAGEVYYEMQRQYQTGKDSFQTLDRLRYYPGTGDGPGYVYYLGIENGSSEYDQHWFHANAWAATALKTVLDRNARPYLVLMSDAGRIQLADAATLDDVTQFSVLEYPAPMLDFVDGLDTHTIYFDSRQSTMVMHHRLDLAAGSECRIDTLPPSSGAMSGDLWVSGEIAQHLSDKTPGTWFEPIRARSGDNRTSAVLLYHPLGRYHDYDYGAQDRGEIPGGIAVVRMTDSRVVDTWQPDLDFAQVIAGGSALYALRAPRDSKLTELYALDAESGDVIESRALDGDQAWSLGYAVLDLTGLGSALAVHHVDACQYDAWEMPLLFPHASNLLGSGS